MKNNLHLTLSNIIKDQNGTLVNEALRFQSLLRKGFADLNLVTVCESSIIHHSLVDFLPPSEFHGEPHEIADFNARHQKLIQDIHQVIQHEITNIKNTNININSTYKGKKSIALEAYPSLDILSFANKVAEKIKTAEDYPHVKGFPPENPFKFAINIIRFFRDLEDGEDQNLIQIVSEINSQLKSEPVKFNLKKLSLVVSDDTLSNPNPEVRQYLI